jgi:prepilin-type N-terminal cleavage/methylation domain-containing protein
MSGKHEGFTLIEMLVVIVILGILMSLAVVGVNAALNTARVTKTEAIIEQLSGCLETYRLRWGDYPPTSLSEFKVALPNEVNNGAEAMTACLASRQKGGSLLGNIRDDQYANVDGDSTSRNLTDWFFGDLSLREIADSYGQPLAYMHWKDYAKAEPSLRRYRFDAASPEVLIEPERSAGTRTFLRPDKFQIQSVGKDGKPGTQDDIRVR